MQLKGLCQLESMHAEVMQITFDFRPRLRNYRDVFQANWVWIRDILIVFTERCFSGYATSRFLDFSVKNKSVKTILLVVLK